MRLKKGVSIDEVRPQIWYALGQAEIIWRDINKVMTVTSLTDGEHMADSLHYKGLACDLRSRDLTDIEKKKVFQRLKAMLDDLGYDIVLEATHFHIEYDPKTGDNSWTTYSLV